MKFNKNKAIAALSLALLLSTQTKPMGADFGIDAGDDIQLTLTEDMKQTLAQQAKQAFAQHSKTAVNALGIAKDASVEAAKSVYNAYMTNPGLYTGIGAGVAGAGLLAYKKPHVAGGIAAAGIAAGQGYLIAKDNPELVEAGKNAAINAGKAVYNYAAANAPVVYNALTNNAVADYIKENPEYVIPAAIAGAFGTYYAYAPVKRGAKAVGNKVAQAAKVVAPYAAKAAVVAAPVAAVAAVAKYSPETLVAAKDAAINAGNAVVEAGKSVANTVVENTPEFVKENSQMIIPTVAVGGFVAAKSAGPVKRGVTKAAQAIAPHTGKIVAAGMVAGAAGLVAYDNQEAIVAGKDAAVAMGKDIVASVMNVDYAQYGKHAVEGTHAFAINNANKLRFTGTRVINAARNLDYKKMAENAGKYLAEQGRQVIADAKQHKIAAGATVGVTAAGSALAGYVAYKANDAKATPVGLEDVRNLYEDASEVVHVKTDKNTSKAIKSAAEQFKLNQVAQAVESLPSVESVTTVVDCSPVSEAEVKAITAVLDPVEVVNPINNTQVESKAEEVSVQAVKKQVTFADPVVTDVRTFTKGSPVNTEVVAEVVNPINNTPSEYYSDSSIMGMCGGDGSYTGYLRNLERIENAKRQTITNANPEPKREVEMVVLPGEDKAPELSVYGPSLRPLPATPAPKAAVKAELPVVVVDRELSKSQKDELNQVVAQLENHNVAQEVETLRAEILAPVQRRAARPLPATPVKAQAKVVRPLPATPAQAPVKAVRPLPAIPAKPVAKAVRPLPATPAQELMERALNIKEMCYLNPDQVIKVGQYMNDLLDGKADLKAIEQDLNTIRREAPLKRDSNMNVASQARVKNA